LRSNIILRARVRAAQYQELRARKRSQLLRGFMFIHLKSDLTVDPVDWLDCQDPYDPTDDARPAHQKSPFTRYGISKKIQKRLAEVRTDLDSFSDAESYALMASAYRMTEYELKDGRCVPGFQEPKERVRWNFLVIEEAMKEPGEKYNYLMRLLGVSNSLAFKIWKLSKSLKITAWILGAALLALAVWAGLRFADRKIVPTVTVGRVGIVILAIIAIALLTFILGKLLMPVARLKNTLMRIGIGVGMSLLGFIAARIHLHFFDKIYLRYGSLETLNRKE
jgi:hypothetical protein